jgi:hypothetical protein
MLVDLIVRACVTAIVPAMNRLFGFYEDAPASFRLVPIGASDAAGPGVDRS